MSIHLDSNVGVLTATLGPQCADILTRRPSQQFPFNGHRYEPTIGRNPPTTPYAPLTVELAFILSPR